METSDWIAICSMIASVLITTIGSALYLSFKIDGSNEKMISMAISINGIREDITSLKSDVGEIRVEMAEMKVKADELWRSCRAARFHRRPKMYCYILKCEQHGNI